MSCCGRSALPDSTPRGGTALQAPSGPSAAPADPLFQYIGARALSVTGPVTGRVYRFDAPGARLVINRHDAASLLHVPTLRPVRR